MDWQCHLMVPVATLNNANTDGSKLMNKSLRDIRVENGLASFRFTVDTKLHTGSVPVCNLIFETSYISEQFRITANACYISIESLTSGLR